MDNARVAAAVGWSTVAAAADDDSGIVLAAAGGGRGMDLGAVDIGKDLGSVCRVPVAAAAE